MLQRILLDEDMFTVHTCHLDHRIPSLGFALKERFHINIDKDSLVRLDLPVGPWLREFKQALWDGKSGDDDFTVEWEEGGATCQREFRLRDLKDSIAKVTEGQKLSYIVKHPIFFWGTPAIP